VAEAPRRACADPEDLLKQMVRKAMGTTEVAEDAPPPPPALDDLLLADTGAARSLARPPIGASPIGRSGDYSSASGEAPAAPPLAPAASLTAPLTACPLLRDGGAFARVQGAAGMSISAPPLGGHPADGGGSGCPIGGSGCPIGGALSLSAGPPMGSVGSAADLQALYRRYSSAPAPQAQPPARKLSMHDSAGSAGLEDVARWGALPGVAQELSTLPRIVSAAWEGHVRRALSAATLARESHLDTHGAAVYARRGYQGWASAWPGVLMLPAALAGGIARWRRPAWPAPARPSR